MVGRTAPRRPSIPNPQIRTRRRNFPCPWAWRRGRPILNRRAQRKLSPPKEPEEEFVAFVKANSEKLNEAPGRRRLRLAHPPARCSTRCSGRSPRACRTQGTGPALNDLVGGQGRLHVCDQDFVNLTPQIHGGAASKGPTPSPPRSGSPALPGRAHNQGRAGLPEFQGQRLERDPSRRRGTSPGDRGQA